MVNTCICRTEVKLFRCCVTKTSRNSKCLLTVILLLTFFYRVCLYFSCMLWETVMFERRFIISFWNGDLTDFPTSALLIVSMRRPYNLQADENGKMIQKTLKTSFKIPRLESIDRLPSNHRLRKSTETVVIVRMLLSNITSGWVT